MVEDFDRFPGHGLKDIESRSHQLEYWDEARNMVLPGNEAQMLLESNMSLHSLCLNSLDYKMMEIQLRVFQSISNLTVLWVCGWMDGGELKEPLGYVNLLL